MKTNIEDFRSLYDEIWAHRKSVQTIRTSYVDRDEDDVETVIALEFGEYRIVMDRHLHKYVVSKMVLRDGKMYVYGRKVKSDNRVSYSERCLMDGPVPEDREGLPEWPRSTP